MEVSQDKPLLFPHFINRHLRYQLRCLWQTLSWAFSVRAPIHSWAFGFYVAKALSTIPLPIKLRLCIKCQSLCISASSTTRSWMLHFLAFLPCSFKDRLSFSHPSLLLSALCPLLLTLHIVHPSPWCTSNKSTFEILSPSCFVTSTSSSSYTI